MLTVVRNNGADGRITVKWRTTDITAVAGKDYEGGQGELIFAHGESTKDIEVKIIDDGEFEKDEHFRVELVEVDGMAEIGKTRQMIVTIVNDDGMCLLFTIALYLANNFSGKMLCVFLI